jgi:hypothetical protein
MVSSMTFSRSTSRDEEGSCIRKWAESIYLKMQEIQESFVNMKQSNAVFVYSSCEEEI